MLGEQSQVPGQNLLPLDCRTDALTRQNLKFFRGQFSAVCSGPVAADDGLPQGVLRPQLGAGGIMIELFFRISLQDAFDRRDPWRTVSRFCRR